jgi:glycosyltransferase involved in cell wall biosynthesis
LASFLRANDFEVHLIKAGKLLYSWKQIWTCTKILRSIKPQVVHCHLAQANFIGLVSAYLASVPTRIYTRHAGQPLLPSRKENMLDQIQNHLATKIIAITENIRQLLLSEGVKDDKIKLVHHGFDIDRMMRPDPSEVRRIKQEYNTKNKYPLVGVIARWMEWKGIQYIIPAFAKLLKKYPNAKLCLFNASMDADYSLEIKEMLSNLPVDSYQIISFEKNIYDLYQLFDIYIHVPVNPYCEAFGQTYVEALAVGIPSVFTLSGIAREFITEDNAYIVDFKNSDDVFIKINTILTEEKDTDRLLKNGQAIVQQMFSLEKYIKTLLEIYQ